MSKFIKLTNVLLNTNDIHKIVIQPNKYYIHIVSKNIDGYNFNFGTFFGVGNLFTHTSTFEICEDLIDYEIVTNWIRKNEE